MDYAVDFDLDADDGLLEHVVVGVGVAVVILLQLVPLQPGCEREIYHVESGLGRARWRRTKLPTCPGRDPDCAGARHACKQAVVGHGAMPT